MRARGTPILLGFFLLWVVLDRSATELGSTMGEGGWIVCALVIVTGVAVEVFVFGRTLRGAIIGLGLRPGRRIVVVWAAAGSAATLLYFPGFSLVTGAPLTLRSDWLALLPGLFLQAGIAEEIIFRGFLFHHLRGAWPFWRAATLSAIPFVAVHLLLFTTMDFAVALASVLLSLALLFPLPWLFEVSRGSILGARDRALRRAGLDQGGRGTRRRACPIGNRLDGRGRGGAVALLPFASTGWPAGLALPATNQALDANCIL